MIPTATPELIKRSSNTNQEPQWVLAKHSDDGNKSVMWSHICRDVDMLVEMLAMTYGDTGGFKAWKPDSNQEITQDSITDLAAVGSNFARPQALDFSVVASQAQNVKPEDVTQLTLAGDLRNVEISNVLQTISLLNMSGKLNIDHKDAQVELYFKEGLLCHAATQQAFQTDNETKIRPEDIVLELMLWKEGNFKFFPGWTTSEETIKKRLEILLLEGATIADYAEGLKKFEFTNSSMLRRAREHTEDELDAILTGGVPVELALQKEFYYRLDAPLPALDLICNLPRSTYLPMVYNLLNTGLVEVAETSSLAGEAATQIFFDSEFAEYGRKSLLRPDSNIMTFPIFLYFLKQEADRSIKHRNSISLIVFSSKDKLTINEHYAKLVAAFDKIKRGYDIIAHFELQDTGSIAILLPNRNSSGGYVFADKYLTKLKEAGVKSEFHFGVASLSQSASDLDNLLRDACKAKERAVRKNLPICTSDELETSTWSAKLKKGLDALDKNDSATAINCFKSCLDEARSFAQDDERLIVTLDTMSQVYMLGGQHKLALSALQAVLKLKEQHSVQEDVAQCVALIGKCYFELGDYAQAEAALLRAIGSFTRIFGPQDITVGNVYHNLATLYHLNKRLDEAKTAYHKSLSIKRKLLGRNDPELLKILKNYTDLLKNNPTEQPTEEVGLISGTWRAIEIQPQTELKKNKL
jgi:tetratricopeptide (TPR) repeat protein